MTDFVNTDKVRFYRLKKEKNIFGQINNETERKDTNMNDNFFAANKILNVFWRRKYHLLVLTVAGLIAGIIFSGPKFIVPRYKSQATVYPSNIASYSEESETEQYMQWLTSQDIKDSIIKQFDLYNHYGISMDNPEHISAMMYEYSKRIKCEQTVYDAVNITVLDKDPQVACDIVNAIIKCADNMIWQVQKEKFMEVIPNAKIGVEVATKNIDSLENYLSNIKNSSSKNGINLLVDPDYLGNVLKLAAMNNINEKYQNELVQAVKDSSRQFSFANVISHPYAADKKSYPVRWIIVVLAGVGMFLLSFFGFLIAENIPDKKE